MSEPAAWRALCRRPWEQLKTGPDPFWVQTLFSPFEAIGIAAYFALLVGQRVPFRKSREISSNEMTLWNARRRANREQAMKAMTVKEALETIRSPKWKWI